MSKSAPVKIPDESVASKIWQVRGKKIMLDRDLAVLYGVKPIRLREQVKRNIERFPSTFMIQLTDEEVDALIEQKAVHSKQSLGGALPFAFTEHGVLMLSNILKSTLAIHVSIRIIEVFVMLRETLLLHKDISILVEQVESRIGKQDAKIEILFSYLTKFLEKEDTPRTEIGFKRQRLKS